MKKLELKLTSKAVSDLEDIWIFTYKRWSKDQADRYYSQIIDEFEFLLTNANIGRSAAYIRSGYRVSDVKSHLIFYKIIEDKQLEVIRILHQSVNIDTWLK